jgi:hypothetical protein
MINLALAGQKRCYDVRALGVGTRILMKLKWTLRVRQSPITSDR